MIGSKKDGNTNRFKTQGIKKTFSKRLLCQIDINMTISMMCPSKFNSQKKTCPIKSTVPILESNASNCLSTASLALKKIILSTKIFT
jgi:hypothetical protein